MNINFLRGRIGQASKDNIKKTYPGNQHNEEERRGTVPEGSGKHKSFAVILGNALSPAVLPFRRVNVFRLAFRFVLDAPRFFRLECLGCTSNQLQPASLFRRRDATRSVLAWHLNMENQKIRASC
jgi:hypothetical protein